MIIPNNWTAIIMVIINKQKAKWVREQNKRLKEKAVFCQMMNSLLVSQRISEMIVVVQMISLALFRINIS